jgi:hypothetical protein
MIRFLSVTVSLLFANGLFANQILGGGITWEQLSKDTFKVTATVLFDCNGTYLRNTPITFVSNCGSMNASAQMNTGLDITPVCDRECTRCQSGSCSFKYGIKQYELTTTIALTQWRRNGCCDVTINWGQCCRSKSFTTGSQNQNFYINAKMNICDSNAFFSSPKWAEDAPSIVCVGQDLIRNLGAFKSNPKDSLIYSFADAKISTSNTTSWTNNYDYNKPFYYLGFPKIGLIFPRGIHLDPITGVLMARTMKIENTLLSYKVDIYQNGIIKGTMSRESPLFIIKCPDNTPPVLSGVNCSQPKTGNFKVNFCANNSNVLEICSYDKDKEDTVTFEYSTDIKGAQIGYNQSERLPKLLLRWKPNLDDLGKTFYLYVKAKDNACPVNGTTSRVYEIRVDGHAAYSVSSFSDSCSNGYFFLKNIDSSKINCVTWQHRNKVIRPCLDSPYSDTPKFSFQRPGSKKITLNIPTTNGCRIIDTIPFSTTSNALRYFSKINDTTMCAYDTIELKTNLHNAVGRTTIKWNKGFTTNSTKSTYKHILSNKSDSLIVAYKDSFCEGSDTVLIEVDRPQLLSFAKDIEVCHADNDTFRFTQLYHDTDSITNYLWSDSTGKPIINTSKTSFYFPYNGKFIFTSTDGFGCQKVDTINYTLHDPLEDFYLTNSILCKNTIDTVKANAVKHGRLNWYDNDTGNLNLIAIDTNRLEVKLKSNTVYNLEYIHDKTGCKAVKTVFTYVAAIDDPKFEIKDNGCAYDSFSVNTHFGKQVWQIDSFIINGNLQFTPLQYGYNEGDIIIRFTGTDSNNCKVDTTIKLLVTETPIFNILAPDTVLVNDTFNPTPSINQNQDHLYFWEFGNPVIMLSNDYQPDVSFDSIGKYSVKLTITNIKNGCGTSIGRKDSLVVKKVPTDINSNFFDFKIYPNPTSNFLYVESDDQVFNASIFSITGKHLKSFKPTSSKAILDLTFIPEGTYIVLIETREGICAKRILKQ